MLIKFSCSNCSSLSVSLLLSLMLFSFQATADTTDRQEQLNLELENYIECFPLELLISNKQQPRLSTTDLCIASLYHQTGTLPLWITPEGPTKKAHTILQFLTHSHLEGLNPEDYQIDKIRSLWQSTDLKLLVQLETLLTFSLLQYIHDISFGKLNPLTINLHLFPEAGEANFFPLSTLESLIVAPDLEVFLKSLPPAHHHYQHLKDALQSYRQIAAKGGWKTIEIGNTLRPGDSHKQMASIRRRLIATGDLEAEQSDELYNKLDESGIRQFQMRHGLMVDGIIGPETLKELNVPLEQRIKMIMLNMARWRWQDHDLGTKYVLINIATYYLMGVEDGKMTLSFPIVVGNFQHQTPVFSDKIKYLDINPYWNIPPTIASNEELPKLRENPYSLVEKNIRLFSNWHADSIELDSTTIDWNSVTKSEMSGYKLRQDPGPLNALGKIKFVFPNRYAVYLHDTPAQDLFSHKKNLSATAVFV